MEIDDFIIVVYLTIILYNVYVTLIIYYAFHKIKYRNNYLNQITFM